MRLPIITSKLLGLRPHPQPFFLMLHVGKFQLGTPYAERSKARKGDQEVIAEIRTDSQCSLLGPGL